MGECVRGSVQQWDCERGALTWRSDGTPVLDGRRESVHHLDDLEHAQHAQQSKHAEETEHGEVPRVLENEPDELHGDRARHIYPEPASQVVCGDALPRDDPIVVCQEGRVKIEHEVGHEDDSDGDLEYPHVARCL